jgi:hypothetical protein
MSGPTYTYTYNVPQPAQPFNQTQSIILNNFQAINELINVNHVAFNTVNTFGKHNFLSLEIQSTDPQTASTDIALYTKATSGGPNAAEIFYRYPNNGTIAQLTGGSSTPATSAATSGGNASAGWCLFPSGVLIKWGTGTTQNGQSTVVFPTSSSIPAYKSGIGYIKTTATGSNTVNIAEIVTSNGYGTTEFLVFISNGTGGSTNFNYFCIGV